MKARLPLDFQRKSSLQRTSCRGRPTLAANRFDFLRLLFAAVVLVYHAWVLTAVAPQGMTERVLAQMAELAIQGFFVVSGALVFGSFERSRGLGDYAAKRVRRLYPAYAVIVLIPAIASGFVTGWSDIEAVGRYLAANLVFLNFLEPDLPGLFSGNPFSEVNGALWTLKIEVMFYMALPILAVILRPFGRAWWAPLLLIYVAAEAWRLLIPVYLDHPLAPQLARQLPGQMAYFASGMVLWKLWGLGKSKAVHFGIVGAGLMAASFVHPTLEPLRAAGLAGMITFVAFAPGPAFRAARFGDISYGLYITHFPIIQVFIMAGIFAAIPFAGFLAVVIFAVLAASYLLWHLVEKPALRRDSHYRVAEEAG